jgi:16S rRNA A1518/A1519 N6-dimethyltransferase RsmA/KsgA/DIM1 with predicted DNA glycosylase/AP lyase activity
MSYEYDPTDVLKIPQLLAEANNEVYVKEKNEDFMTLLSGVMGQKKRIHIQIGDVLDTEIDKIKEECSNSNKQIQALAQVIDASIIKNYKLWPTNYIAYDILNKTKVYSHLYTADENRFWTQIRDAYRC